MKITIYEMKQNSHGTSYRLNTAEEDKEGILDLRTYQKK
jgi:hypothetical protein